MRGIRVSDRDSGRTGRHDGFRVARRTVTAIAARDLVPRSSFDRRSIESRVPWRRRIPRWRPRRRPPGEEDHPRFLRSWDPWCVGCAGTVRAIGAGRRQSLLRRETRKNERRSFGEMRGSRTNGRSWDFASSLVIARALYARRSTLDRVPPDAPRRTTAATRSFHVIFSASRSHFSTAAAGTSPLSPPCSTHVSFGLGGGASASPGGSPKNLMA